MNVEVILGVAAILGLVAVVGSVTFTFTTTVSGPVSASQDVTISDDTGVQVNPSVPAAQPASLTVRTTNTAGTLTMTNASHGIITGQRVDLYWTGGQCYGAVVGTVAGTSVPIASVSGGSVLPSAGTNITVGIATSKPFPVTGNNLSCLMLNLPSGQNGYFVFNNGSADVYAAFITGGYISSWKTGDPNTNPLAASVPTVVYMSHNNTTGPVTGMKAAAGTH